MNAIKPQSAQFTALAAFLRSGGKLPTEAIDRILQASGRSHRDLVAAIVARPRGAQPGDRCPECGGRIGVYRTISTDDRRTQYLKCKGCGSRPEHNKRVICYSGSKAESTVQTTPVC